MAKPMLSTIPTRSPAEEHSPRNEDIEDWRLQYLVGECFSLLLTTEPILTAGGVGEPGTAFVRADFLASVLDRIRMTVLGISYCAWLQFLAGDIADSMNPNEMFSWSSHAEAYLPCSHILNESGPYVGDMCDDNPEPWDGGNGSDDSAYDPVEHWSRNPDSYHKFCGRCQQQFTFEPNLSTPKTNLSEGFRMTVHEGVALSSAFPSLASQDESFQKYREDSRLISV